MRLGDKTLDIGGEEEVASSREREHLAGILPALAPAAVSRRRRAASPYRKKTEDLKKQDARGEVAYVTPSQNLEENVSKDGLDQDAPATSRGG